MSVDVNFLSVECPKCGAVAIGELTPDKIHYGKATCECGYRWWLPKPLDDPTKYRRPASSTNLAKGDICQMCFRSRAELPGNSPLEGHHIIPVKDGGSDDPENIWEVCRACHRLIEWARTYHGGNRSVE